MQTVTDRFDTGVGAAAKAVGVEQYRQGRQEADGLHVTGDLPVRVADDGGQIAQMGTDPESDPDHMHGDE